MRLSREWRLRGGRGCPTRRHPVAVRARVSPVARHEPSELADKRPRKMREAIGDAFSGVLNPALDLSQYECLATC